MYKEMECIIDLKNPRHQLVLKDGTKFHTTKINFIGEIVAKSVFTIELSDLDRIDLALNDSVNNKNIWDNVKKIAHYYEVYNTDKSQYRVFIKHSSLLNDSDQVLKKQNTLTVMFASLLEEGGYELSEDFDFIMQFYLDEKHRNQSVDAVLELSKQLGIDTTLKI